MKPTSRNNGHLRSDDGLTHTQTPNPLIDSAYPVGWAEWKQEVKNPEKKKILKKSWKIGQTRLPPPLASWVSAPVSSVASPHTVNLIFHPTRQISFLFSKYVTNAQEIHGKFENIISNKNNFMDFAKERNIGNCPSGLVKKQLFSVNMLQTVRK